MLAEKMLNVRLPQELAAQLDTLTKSTGRTKSALTVEALRGYLEAENWQIADIQAGVEEANRGEFASTEEVKAFFAKHDC
jgi:RHH-type transcriptional regulator, rel operon repressor / antitoxin RelB